MRFPLQWSAIPIAVNLPNRVSTINRQKKLSTFSIHPCIACAVNKATDTCFARFIFRILLPKRHAMLMRDILNSKQMRSFSNHYTTL